MQQVWIQCTQVTRKESVQPATSLAHGPCRQTAALLLDIVFRLKEIQPKDWVNSMVVSSRGDKIRICLDLGDLNKSVKWNIIQFLRSKKFHPKYLMLNSKCSQSSTLEWVSANETWLRVQLTNNQEHSNKRIQMVEATFWNHSAAEMYQWAMPLWMTY